MGVLPQDQLSTSTAPFAEAAELIWGSTGMYIIGFGAMISTFGALNGWILIQGQIPVAMADDDLLPPLFKIRSKRNFPIVSLIISSIIVTVIVLANSSRGLVEIFTLLILVGTFLSLISYLFSSMAEVLILIKRRPDNWKKRSLKAFLLSFPAFGFSIIAIYGAGMEIVYYGFLVLVLGIPLYIWSKIKQSQKV